MRIALLGRNKLALWMTLGKRKYFLLNIGINEKVLMTKVLSWLMNIVASNLIGE